MKYLGSSVLLAVISMSVNAQEYEVRSEFMYCKLNEGKAIADAIADSKRYGAFSKSADLENAPYRLESAMASAIAFPSFNLQYINSDLTSYSCAFTLIEITASKTDDPKYFICFPFLIFMMRASFTHLYPSP